ncbi:hypothetical protein ZWY2020_054319 [Hordeum vulgare]|nr:hypothetical protein ZWY2020_054319 [Hordeum vulgare]
MAPVFTDLAKKFPNAVFLKVGVDDLKGFFDYCVLRHKVHVKRMPNFQYMFCTLKVHTFA